MTETYVFDSACVFSQQVLPWDKAPLHSLCQGQSCTLELRSVSCAEYIGFPKQRSVTRAYVVRVGMRLSQKLHWLLIGARNAEVNV